MASYRLLTRSLLTLFSYPSGDTDIVTSQALGHKISSTTWLQLPQKREVYVQRPHTSMATEPIKALKGSLSHDYGTGLPAADVWEVYGGLLVGGLIPKLLPQVFSKVELVEGDGGVGTVLLVTCPPGTPGSETFKEKFIKVDNENYIKETLVTEGAFLDHGFQKYLIRIEIIGNEEKTSIIRSTIEYEIDHEHANNPPVVSTSDLATIAEAITKYIKEQKGPE